MKRFLNACAIIATTLLLVIVSTTIAGARFNVSESFPRGLYWSRHIVPKTNDLVYFRPPRSSVFDIAKERDYIEPSPLGTYQPLIKKIVAEEGDMVSVTDEGVIVNGKEIPNSKPLDRDSAGRLLPRFRITERRLVAREVFLLSDVNPRSFDGRYFGPTQRRSIREAIQPVLTW
jgi:conjugative transfer signal peptidase TraF